MRVPYLWLKEYLEELTLDPEEAGELLTRSGVEVDGVEDFNPGIKGIVAGLVIKREPHPSKDSLSVVEVDIGQEKTKTIICGAPNVREGQCVFTALPGSVLPGNKQIDTVEFQGIISEGMLCSAAEMGLELVQGEDGILTMDDPVAPGTDLLEYLQINDKIITLSLTPNRADCLGLIGVAYELAALTGEKVVKPPEIPEEVDIEVASLVSVDIKESNLCRRYTARVIRDIDLKPAPLWMQIRLLKAGVRPISI